MTSADELRLEDSGDDDRARYACADCGVALGAKYDSCPECGGTTIVTVGEILDPSFRE